MSKRAKVVKVKKDEKGRKGGERKEISQVFSDDSCAKKAIFPSPFDRKKTERKCQMSHSLELFHLNDPVIHAHIIYKSL
jgi:hypothetical protein